MSTQWFHSDKLSEGNMIKKTYLIIWCLFLSTLAGCGGFRAFPKAPFDMKDQIESTRFAFDPMEYKRYYDELDEQKQSKQRNKIINAQIRAYDIRFAEYEQDLFEMGLGLGVGTDWASPALSGLTATVGGTTLKSAFGAINAGIVGAKGAVDKHLFMEKTLPVIMTEITSQRTAVLVQIRSGLHQPVTEYGLDQGLSDIQRYSRASSIASGLNGILASSGTKLQDNLNVLNNLTTLKYSDDLAGRKIEAFLMPEGELDATNKEKLEAVMVELGLTTGRGRIARLITAKEFTTMRIKVVEKLELK